MMLGAESGGLKIRFSVIQFHPGPPSNQMLQEIHCIEVIRIFTLRNVSF
jgi:hypothetical protein